MDRCMHIYVYTDTPGPCSGLSECGGFLSLVTFCGSGWSESLPSSCPERSTECQRRGDQSQCRFLDYRGTVLFWVAENFPFKEFSLKYHDMDIEPIMWFLNHGYLTRGHQQQPSLVRQQPTIETIQWGLDQQSQVRRQTLWQ